MRIARASRIAAVRRWPAQVAALLICGILPVVSGIGEAGALPDPRASVQAMLSTECGGIGTRVVVKGSGLAGGELWFDGIRSETAYESAPAPGVGVRTETLSAYVPAGSKTGPLTLRLPSGETRTLADSFEVPQIMVPAVHFTQGVPGYPLIWGKTTLVQIFPLAAESAPCQPEVDAAVLTALTGSGDGRSYQAVLGNGRGLPIDAEGKQFLRVPIGTESSGSVSAAANIRLNGLFPDLKPDDLVGFTYELYRNGQLAASGEVNASDPQFPHFTRIEQPPSGVVVYFTLGGERSPGYWSTLAPGLTAVAQDFPEPGTGWESMFRTVYYYPLSAPISLDSSTFGTLSEILARYKQLGNPRPDFVVGVLDPAVFIPPQGTDYYAIGMSWWGGQMVSVSLNDVRAGATMAHELGHSYGLVLPHAANEDESNIAHSRYDEGAGHEGDASDGTWCDESLTFGQSLADQVPATAYRKQPYVVNVTDLSEYPVASGNCFMAAKSIMSYAPRRLNNNTFFEYDDYQYLVKLFQQGAVNARPNLEPVFRIVGSIPADGPVQIAQSQLTRGIYVPNEDSESPYALLFRDGEGKALSEYRFPVSSDDYAGEIVFEAVAPFPSGAHTVEIRRKDAVLGRLVRSGIAPVVRIDQTGPLHLDNEPFQLTWKASDLDSTELVSDVYWSGDGGWTFRPLALGLRENNAEIWPGLLPGGAGMIRVVVSDGFETGTSEIEIETADKAPVVGIYGLAVDWCQSGEPVLLTGSAYDLEDGVLAAGLQWLSDRDGLLGTGPSVSARLTAGHHEIRLVAKDSGGNVGEAQISIDVSAGN